MTKNEFVLQTLQAKFGPDACPDQIDQDISALAPMVARGACRSFRDTPVPPGLLRILCATALATPTKSDLQQRDIILIEDPALKSRLLSLVSHQPWTGDIPHLLVFCGNNRRQRLLHDWHDIEFANDHLDAFFNAAADAAIALAGFVTAADALGLGCCPISAIRDHAKQVSDLLALPNHVFPFAGLALGYPQAETPKNSMRLPLSVTLHTDRYSEDHLRDTVRSYDTDREQAQPYRQQRFEQEFGTSPRYGWSLDKARQYSAGERTDFGAYIRSIGFRL